MSWVIKITVFSESVKLPDLIQEFADMPLSCPVVGSSRTSRSGSRARMEGYCQALALSS
jgi:hypothetical protein